MGSADVSAILQLDKGVETMKKEIKDNKGEKTMTQKNSKISKKIEQILESCPRITTEEWKKMLDRHGNNRCKFKVLKENHVGLDKYEKMLNAVAPISAWNWAHGFRCVFMWRVFNMLQYSEISNEKKKEILDAMHGVSDEYATRAIVNGRFENMYMAERYADVFLEEMMA